MFSVCTVAPNSGKHAPPAAEAGKNKLRQARDRPLARKLMVCRVYAMSVLQYLGQFAAPPPSLA